jgi:hypothetical protein
MFGFVLPSLFSAKSDTAFFIGLLALIAFPVFLYFSIKKLTKKGVKNEEV